MRIIILIFSLTISLNALSGDKWLIIPGKQVGKITKESGIAAIKQAYGSDNVKEEQIPIGEGEVRHGISVFSDDPLKRIELLLSDKGKPIEARFTGDKSLWHTKEGVSLGLSLIELEKINKGKFTLTDFGWDYSGTVISWNDGYLSKYLKPGRTLIIRLHPDSHGYPGSLLGDKDILYSDPDMNSANPDVYNIIVFFKR